MSKKPVFILVNPSLSQNIGSAARAMLNFGFDRMRLVNPNPGWLNDDARALCADADEVLEKAEVFRTLKEAIADCHHTYATTARPRDMIKEVVHPDVAGQEINTYVQETDHQVGVLFGSEKCGLDNDDVALCDKIITVPLNPHFSSINLAQSVLLVAYELFQQSQAKMVQDPLWDNDMTPATKEEVHSLIEHLDQELDKSGYFRVEARSHHMRRTLNNMFSRVRYTSQEIKTLRGVIATLTNPLGKTLRKSPQK